MGWLLLRFRPRFSRFGLFGSIHKRSSSFAASDTRTFDYEQERSTFRIDVPERFNFARDVFDKRAESDSDALALLLDFGDGFSAKRRTYGQVAADSMHAAAALSSLGVGDGDVVLLNLPRVYEWWTLCLACLRVGAVASPGTTLLRSGDLLHRANAAGAKALIGTAEVLSSFETVADRCPSIRTVVSVGTADDDDATVGTGGIGGARRVTLDDALAATEGETFSPSSDTASGARSLLFFTSGTTGAPKMASHSHASYGLGHAVTARYWLDLRPGDLHWNLSDTGWAKAAWSSFYAPFTSGAAVFVDAARGPQAFDPARTLDLMTSHPITSFCAAPTVYRTLVQQPLERWNLRSRSSLRHCVSAGEPLNPEVIDRWEEETSIVVRDGYGQTETCLLVGSFPFIEPRRGSMGKPAPGYDVQVLNADGAVCADGEEGDIAVRCTGSPDGSSSNALSGRPVGLFDGYWRDEEKTAASFRQNIHGDTFYLTGDRAMRDADGYLWFVGRADDVIITAGYRVGPFEVESALIEHPAVVESAVVSSHDSIRGAVVKAFVVPSPQYASVLMDGANAQKQAMNLVQELQNHCKAKTAPYKYPRKIQFVEELPKTASGKIRRVELREREQ